jgi:antirestriction protein ArdC
LHSPVSPTGRGSDAPNLNPKGKQIVEKADLYTRITNRIIAELEAGTRPWLKPWNAEHAAGRIPARCATTEYRTVESTSSRFG